MVDVRISMQFGMGGGPKRTWPKPRVRLVDLERADADVHTGDREALTPPARCAMHAFACLTNGSSVCGNFRQARKRLARVSRLWMRAGRVTLTHEHHASA